MKCNKIKKNATIGISFVVLSVMQLATASTESMKTFELTYADMDMLTAGSAASADAYAHGNSTLATTDVNTDANQYANYGVGSAVATFCCNNGSGSTNTTASATGNTVGEYHGSREGRGYSASWSAAYGY
jgi:hypothetical protein